jgi:translocation and assembly module TamB
MQAFHWKLFCLEADAEGIVIHGRERTDEVPYARIEALQVQISILDLLSPHIQLRQLNVIHPALHFVVYPDGTTNQPTPRRPAAQQRPMLDTFFALKAGQVTIQQGVLDYENRAAAFDFQNRQAPLDLSAKDASVQLTYMPPRAKAPESYRIALAAHDLQLLRGTEAQPLQKPVLGAVEATIDLTRTDLYLRSLRLTARSKDTGPRVLNVTGELRNFARPNWEGTVQGELDMRLLETFTGYPNAPEGIARMRLEASGYDGQFHVDGPVHIDKGSYIAPGVDARGVTLDSIVHADPNQLVIRSVTARLAQGGDLKGDVTLDHWLPPIPGSTVMEQATPVQAKHFWQRRKKPSAKPAPISAPNQPAPLLVNGKVTAELEDISLDAVMDIVGKGPFERLGLDARLDGPATATWSKGDVATLAIGVNVRVSPSGRPQAGESAASGVLDGSYTQRDGTVDLRALHLTLPGSEVDASGHIGAYPMTSPSVIAVEVHSHNLAEFDQVLRDLGLAHNGKIGSAALPVSLGGQADFSGSWTGSVLDPHLSGTLTANHVTFEIPRPSQSPNSVPATVRVDSLQARGSYSATRIAIDQGDLLLKQATLHVTGTLTASPIPHRPGIPSFDGNSVLHAHLQATNFVVDDLQPILGTDLPVHGALSGDIQLAGMVHALDGSGWMEMDQGTLWNQPVARIRAQGQLKGQSVQITAASFSDEAGKTTASGFYDLQTRKFQMQASGSNIQLAQIRRVQDLNLDASGMLRFQVSGSGSIDDPYLEGTVSLRSLYVRGEEIGEVDLTARTRDHALQYDLQTHFASAVFQAHGQTILQRPFETQAIVQISQFNIGTLLKLAHVQGLSGESSLAGTIRLEGPLTKPAELRGDAELQTAELTVSGVHLRSEGPMHARLSNEKIVFDPVHITGEETDLRANGAIDLNARRQLNLNANGTINLKLAETIDPDLTASGMTRFEVQARGTLENPRLSGRIQFDNASLALQDLPNSLSQLQGTLVFNQNRLEVQSLTARTGGGTLSVGGYLAYQSGLYAALSLTGQNVRIRYPEGVSSLADANLQLQGTQNSLLLSGRVLVTRFSVSPDLDIAGLVAQAGKAQSVTSPDSPSNHVRLDVRIQSSPQLNFQNAYAKLAGDIDVRLRGTLATPSLLGRVSITEGNATIAGTRYDVQRGDITFSNPVRIEPTIDLNATARVEDYDIALGLHGPPNKMAVTYRSDPPLPESDVVALLALGRTQNQERLYTQQQQQLASNPATDSLLGGALNATVSSRVQKLFGAGSVKVDPSYLGLLGNSTTRITVEEQVGRNVTLTWATDVDTTAQQLLQAEIAINRHVSLLIARDESEVFSMVIKATRRYR